MGELHLEIIVDRLLREFQVDGRTSASRRSPTSETILQARRGRGPLHPPVRRHAASTATSCSRSSRTRAARASTSRPRSCERPRAARVLPAIEQGVREALQTGRRSPASRWSTCACAWSTARYHEVDSSELAFKIAGVDGREGRARRGQAACCSSPSCSSRWSRPRAYMGAVIDDLNARRGRITMVEPRGNAQVIQAEVPLGNDVRLREQPALDHAGSRDLHDEVSTTTLPRPSRSRPSVGSQPPNTRPRPAPLGESSPCPRRSSSERSRT